MDDDAFDPGRDANVDAHSALLLVQVLLLSLIANRQVDPETVRRMVDEVLSVERASLRGLPHAVELKVEEAVRDSYAADPDGTSDSIVQGAAVRVEPSALPPILIKAELDRTDH